LRINLTKFIDTEHALDHSKQSKRLIFIDLMRAYAILMMVQGHTIDTCLDPIYRNNDYILYYIWNFFRGITAPVFFFSSGAIFSYLLLRKDMPFWKNERVIKGFKRVGLLLFTGYLLRFNPSILSNLSNFDIFSFQSSVAVDALHCISFGLLSLILLYGLYKWLKVPVWLSYPLFGAFLFFIYPTVFYANWLDIFPLPITNYFTSNYGSNFPLSPWMGFVLWGGFYGYILSKSAGIAYNTKFSIATIIVGLSLVSLSGIILGNLYTFTGMETFDFLQKHNFQFFHLGNVLIISGILSIVANYLSVPEFISNTGKKTMMIYIVHIFIIYGTGINKGFRTYIGDTLSPLPTVLLALIMVLFFIILAQYSEKIRNTMQNLFKRIKP